MIPNSGQQEPTRGGVSVGHRSDIGIEELRGHIFIYGNKTQPDKYIRGRKSLSLLL
jgi:hypothetical protein